MARDARISTTLPAHPKTKKLIRRHGEGAAWRLICLFLWVAENRSDGSLAGMTVEDIELAADWQGEEGVFVAALVDVGFLDGEDGSYSVHDWAEHNPWAAGSSDRSEASRWAALCKRYGRKGAAERMPDYAARMRPADDSHESACDPDAELCDPHATRRDPHAPGTDPQCPVTVTVSDTVTNTKTPRVGSKLPPPCPHDEIIALYHELVPVGTQVRIWTEQRRKRLQARWRESPKHQSLDFWRRFFEHVSESEFLTGRAPTAPGRDPFVVSLDWLINPTNFVKVIEGNYHRGAA